MSKTEVYIPSCLSVNKNTQYYKGKSSFVKFTIWLKENNRNFGVIDYCYTKQDLEIFGAATIEKTIIHHFQNHRILYFPADIETQNFLNIFLEPSDFEQQDYLVIKDLYYPEDMTLPRYCKTRRINHEQKR